MEVEKNGDCLRISNARNFDFGYYLATVVEENTEERDEDGD